MPLRLRLALIYGLLASLALALAVLLAYGYYARATYRNLDGSLAVLLEPVRQTLAEQGRFPEGIEAYRSYPFAIRYYDPGGRLVESAGNEPQAPQVEPGKVLKGGNPLPYGWWVALLPRLRASSPPPAGSAYGLLGGAGERWRVYVTPVRQGGRTLGYLQAVGSLAGFDRAVAELRLNLIGAWVAGSLLVLGLGYLLSSPALTPLTRLARSAGRLVASSPVSGAEPWPERGAQGPNDSGLARLSETLDTAFAQLRSSEGRFRALVEAISQIVWVRDAAGNFADPQPGWERFTGQSFAQYRGQGWLEAVHPEHRERVAGVWEKAIREGQRYEVEYPLRRHDGAYCWFEVRAVPVRNPDGTVREWVGIHSDISERKRQEGRLHFLQEASERLSRSLEPHAALVEAARMVVPALGDWCGVYLPGQDETLEPLVIYHTDPAKVELVQRMLSRYPIRPDAPQGTGAAFRTGKAQLLPVITDALFEALVADPERLEMLKGLELRSGMSLPLVARGEVLGVIDVVSSDPHRRYDPADLALGEEFARRAAAALDNARLLQGLRQSEARYRSLVEASAQVVWRADREGRLLEPQARWSILSGMPPEELPKDLLELVHPEDREPGNRRWWRAIERKGALSFEQRVRWAGGGYRHWQVRAAPIFDADGSVREWIGTDSDITERKRAEEALKQSEQHIRTVLESLPVGVIVAEAPSGRLVQSNREVERIWRQPFIAAEGVSEYRQCLGYYPDGRELKPEEWPLARTLRTGEAVEGQEIRIRRGDGTLGTILVSSVPLRDASGALVAGVVAFSDISDRKLAEERLGRLQRVTSSFAEAQTLPEVRRVILSEVTAALGAAGGALRRVEDGALVVDTHELGPHLSNQTVRRFAHLPLEVASAGTDAARSGEAVFIPDLADFARRYPELLEPLREDRTQASAHLPLKRGEEVFAVLSLNFAEPHAWDEGERAFALALAERAAVAYERARLFEELRASEERYRKLAEAQKRFVADAAHELRAPLTSIQGNLEILLNYPQMPQTERQEALQDATRESRRLARLVNDLLALARGDAGLRLRQVPVDLGAALEELVSETRPLFKRHRLETCLHQPLEVQGDRDQLKQLALILLENAVKYTPPGGEVRLELASQNGQAVLRVADTGIGIAPEDLPHVFERFYRADRARMRGEDPGGSGLGLSIAKWIVDQHGGEIWLESELGEGTTAIVRLPTRPP